MYGRDWSKYDKEKFRDDVSIQQWNYQSNDPSFLMGDFFWRLDGSTERHNGVKKLSPNEIKLRLNSWITPDIKNDQHSRSPICAKKKENPTMKRLSNRTKLLEIGLAE